MTDKTVKHAKRADAGPEDHLREKQQNRQDQLNREKEKPRKLGLLQMLASALAAAFGVQSSKNKERDFSQGDPKRFIVLGIVMTLVFLLVMMGIVRLVLSL